MARVKYREGDWFAVPLHPSGFAVGVVARANKKAALLGYFFGPIRSEVPQLGNLVGLVASDADLVRKFGHLGLTSGKWPILGQLGDWDRSAWPMPALVRYEELTGRSFLAHYADDDPSRLVREEQIPPGAAEHGPKDGLMGAGFVEKLLANLLQ